MNDVLFACTYTDSVELLRESYSKVRFKRKVDLGYCLLFLAAFVSVLAVWQNKSHWHLLSLVLLGAGVYSVLYPVITAYRVMDSIDRANQGNIPPATITLTDKITHQYKLDTSVLLYADLRLAYFLKRSIVLLSDEAYVTFDREGFTKGTPEELEKYLKERCPHVEIINKNG